MTLINHGMFTWLNERIDLIIFMSCYLYFICSPKTAAKVYILAVLNKTYTGKKCPPLKLKVGRPK